MEVNTNKKEIKKVHFMGIGGSGLSGVAILAKKFGFTVSGCNLDKETAYIDKVLKENIPVFYTHSERHLNNIDLLVASPAIHFQNPNHPEIKKAQKNNIFMDWSRFVGEYLLKEKKVIAISGTHGKGTVTSMISQIFEQNGLDPTVLIGATIKDWGSNWRYGKSDIFVIEADEFYEKYLDYNPSTIIINNIEFDHPDYFKSENEIISSFSRFVRLLKKDSNLIVNMDSEGVIKLMSKALKYLKGVNLWGYTINSTCSKPPYLKDLVNASIHKLGKDGNEFQVFSEILGLNDLFRTKSTGEFNISNALGAIIVSKIFNIETENIKEKLQYLSGIGRRMDKVYDKNGIVLYDDYAHHPTAINKTLGAIRQLYPMSRIWAIDEPHSFSRTKALLPLYENCFNSADKVIIGPIYKARDTKKYGVNSYSIVKVSKHKDIKFVPAFSQILNHLKKDIKVGDVIIVMGAGVSYQWTKEIEKMLENRTFK